MSQQPIVIDTAGALAPKLRATDSNALKQSVIAMRAATKNAYSDERVFVNLCVDPETVAACTRLAQKYRDVSLVILVGIGGPNLAVRSVHEALLGALPEHDQRPKILYADTTDAHQAVAILSELDRTLKSNRKVLVILASKSGSTTESVANAQLYLARLAASEINWAKRVVAITDENSPLWHEARSHGIATLTIPAIVGGRYSVFSAMGIFPLAVLGIDTTSLLAGAAAMRARCLALNVDTNPAAQLAAIQYAHGRAGRNIVDYFVFSKDLESVGRWYRQLLAESCGKERDKTGKKILRTGYTPTVSVGSNDLHSVGQLSLGGPDDKCTFIVNVERAERIAVPKNGPLRGLMPGLAGTEFHSILQAITKGTILAYADAKRPVVSITLPARDAYSVGQLLQLHLMQTVYVAELLRVNAFDQPAVEAYKKHTRTILEKN